MAFLLSVGNGMKLRCRATAELQPWCSPRLLCVQLKVQGLEQHGDIAGRERQRITSSLAALLPNLQVWRWPEMFHYILREKKLFASNLSSALF